MIHVLIVYLLKSCKSLACYFAIVTVHPFALHCIDKLLVLVLAVNQITDWRSLPNCFAIVFFQSSIRRIILRSRFEYQTIQTRVDISNTNDSAKKNMFSLCEIYSHKLLT